MSADVTRGDEILIATCGLRLEASVWPTRVATVCVTTRQFAVEFTQSMQRALGLPVTAEPTEGWLFNMADEGVTWARSHDGLARDALRAARALIGRKRSSRAQEDARRGQDCRSTENTKGKAP